MRVQEWCHRCEVVLGERFACLVEDSLLKMTDWSWKKEKVGLAESM